MPRTVKFHRNIAIAILSYLIILVSGWQLIYVPSQQLQEVWLGNSHLLKNKSVEISRLTKEFGYTGFIHHFKNYLIRREPVYLDQAKTSMEATQAAITNLEMLFNEPQDLNEISSIKSTFALYQKDMQWLLNNLDLASTMPISELDDLLRVDDERAHIALLNLYDRNEALLREAEADSKHQFQILVLKLASWLIFLSIFYWTSVGFLLRYSARMKTYTNHLSAINDVSPSAMVMIDQRGRILGANLKFRKMFLVGSNAQLKKMTIEDFIPERFRHRHQHDRMDFLKSNRMSAMEDRDKEFFGRRLDGEEFPAEISVATIEDAGERKAIAIIQDRTREHFLTEQANTDFLTKAHNRKYAEEQLADELYRHHRYHNPLSVLLIDVDYFKKINDQFGHAAGDQVLITVVNLIEANLRQSDTLSRWGGDEFIVFLPNTGIKDANELGQKLVNLVEQHYRSSTFPVTLSIGITEAIDNQHPKDILNAADAALYVAKDNGRNQCSVVFEENT
ncbi:diguanylate cyclase [Reinekea sp. G2M2-21]|uniref:GGDEF domain-containing protein n=1 Tax=Reinekea sp. G2M2-21 TaxID=2788942 RepID=UPI0018A9C276|nr:sensor domain-containing diguanylate cyclase [Reinekea sp. G2M2-21]